METVFSIFQSRLQKAVNHHGRETTKEVLDYYLDPDGCFKRIFFGKPAVCVCAQFDNIELLTLLTKLGLDLEQCHRDGMTPLHIAANAGYKDLVGFLLSKGANVNPKNPNQSTPLHLASEGMCLEIVKLLVEAGAMLDCVDVLGFTPLLHACNQGHWPMASFLVEKGADVNVQGPDGKTPLMLVACAYDVCMHMMQLLSDILAAKASVHTRNDRGETPLHAIVYGNRYDRRGFMLEALEVLLPYECDVNARTVLGHTPLHYAVLSENETAVLALIRAGCSVDIENESCLTPISYAIRDDSHRLTELLLAAGASISLSEWMRLQEVLRIQDPSMLERMRVTRTEVPKLTNFCRRAFLKRYGIEFWNRLDVLELPTTLKQYLAFETFQVKTMKSSCLGKE